MNFDERQLKIAKFLSGMALIYQKRYIGDNQCKEVQFKDGYEALIVFLDKFAYERRGAPKSYSKIAKRSIRGVYNNRASWSIPTKNDVSKVWDKYKDIAKKEFKNLKLNETHNPMNGNLSMNGKKGVLLILADEEVSNIATHVRDLMIEEKTRDAYNFIKSVRGVGEKISSMYLRDIAYLAGLDENNISELYLLQPIDIWVEETLEIIFESNVPQNRREKQELIVELCKEAEVSSIPFNQGVWVFGSQIAGEFEVLKKLLFGSSFDSAQSKIEKCIDEEEKYLKVLTRVLSDLKSTKS